MRKFQVELDATNKTVQQKNDELFFLNETKDKFFSILSHDLRNPITSINLMAQVLQNLMRNESSIEDLGQQIEKIVQSIKSLQDLFDNLYRWSKTQNGEIHYNPEDFDLKVIVDQVVDATKA